MSDAISNLLPGSVGLCPRISLCESISIKYYPSIFALRKLRSHNLQPLQLYLVARTTTVASLLYASPAWWGFASAEERARLEGLIARMKRGGYLPQDFPTFEALARTAGHQLFKSIIANLHHVLRR